MISYEDQTNAAQRPVTASSGSTVQVRSRYHNPIYQFFKRAFDIFFSFFALGNVVVNGSKAFHLFVIIFIGGLDVCVVPSIRRFRPG